MATSMYYTWNDDGRPISPAKPIREIVERMKVAYPDAASLFSWYADDAHYEADYPQDHTPYSVTPWPITPNPYPYVFATDIMHRPDLGVDCNVLFAYWLAEAKAGRMPWLKYMIWQGKRYSVSNGWAPQTNSGHYDHIHLSTRTDHQFTSLGTWKLIPERDSMTPAQEQQLLTQVQRIYDEVHDLHFLNFTLDSAPRPPDSLAGKVERIVQAVEAETVGDGLSADEIRAIVREEIDKTKLGSV